MGTSIFRGITSALGLMVLTLAVVLGATWWGVPAASMSIVVDIGLVASCLMGAYRATRTSGRLAAGVVAALGYTLLAMVLLSLYFPLLPLGALKILLGGLLLGFLAGLAGKGSLLLGSEGQRQRRGAFPPSAYASRYSPGQARYRAKREPGWLDTPQRERWQKQERRYEADLEDPAPWRGRQR